MSYDLPEWNPSHDAFLQSAGFDDEQASTELENYGDGMGQSAAELGIDLKSFDEAYCPIPPSQDDPFGSPPPSPTPSDLLPLLGSSFAPSSLETQPSAADDDDDDDNESKTAPAAKETTVEGLQLKLEDTEGQRDGFRDQVDEKDQALSSMKAELDLVNKQLEETTLMLRTNLQNTHKEEKEASDNKAKHWEKEANREAGNIQTLQVEYDAAKKKWEATELKFQRQLQDAEKKHLDTEVDRRLKDAFSNFENAIKDIAQKNHEIILAEERTRVTEEVTKAVTEQVEHNAAAFYENKLKTQGEQVSQAQSDLQNSQKREREQETHIEETTESIAALRQEIAALQDQNNQLHANNGDLKNTMQSLQDVDSLQRAREEIRSLKGEKEKLEEKLSAANQLVVTAEHREKQVTSQRNMLLNQPRMNAPKIPVITLKTFSEQVLLVEKEEALAAQKADFEDRLYASAKENASLKKEIQVLVSRTTPNSKYEELDAEYKELKDRYGVKCLELLEAKDVFMGIANLDVCYQEGYERGFDAANEQIKCLKKELKIARVKEQVKTAKLQRLEASNNVLLAQINDGKATIEAAKVAFTFSRLYHSTTSHTTAFTPHHNNSNTYGWCKYFLLILPLWLLYFFVINTDSNHHFFQLAPTTTTSLTAFRTIQSVVDPLCFNNFGGWNELSSQISHNTTSYLTNSYDDWVFPSHTNPPGQDPTNNWVTWTINRALEVVVCGGAYKIFTWGFR